MIKFSKMAILVIFILLVFMSPSFALDNETADAVDAGIGEEPLATDIYVNASTDGTGDGSIDNPYRNLENVKIEKDSVVHLTDGNYSYKSFRSLNNVTIIGQSMNSTVISCNRLEITSNILTLKNLTIIGATFKNQGDFTAENVIFRDSVGHALDEYGNSYGGCIYTSYKQDDEKHHLISLTDCHFFNNSAEYGGAIYIDEGYMEINNCFFINNHAYNYGGAISAVNANKITIKKSRFVHDYSTNDCGGAIYVLSTGLTLDDVEISDCSSTFGAAITGLNAQFDINKLYSIGNVAKYDGGAIYQMYGTALITASSFINNSANNGGALFLDNVTKLLLISNSFINNSAKLCAGAFYSISNIQYSNIANVYENNHASINDDVYNVTTINPIMQSSNYTSFRYVPQGDIILPEYYNLVDDGFVTPVKDQQDSGNCWSFAVLAALESCILKSSNVTYDLSEENMKNLMASFSDYGWQIDVNEGGYDDMGVGYLVGWLGPILESQDMFDDRSSLSPLLNSILHIQNVVYLKRENYLDNDGIKEAILRYGAVATGIYYSGLYLLGSSYYYYDTIMPSNHAVTIVGWDDDYSRFNFNHVPEGDGAFIVKNSWGTDWGDNGYFYVSYYDTKFAQVGRDEVSYTFILNDTIKYDKNYQYDISGKTDYLITGQSTIWYQNIFNATGNEYLAAVSTYFNAPTDWVVSIYVNDAFRLNKSGHSPAGYYTINLGDLISINPGDIFRVVFKLDCEGYANVPILESRYINKVPFSSGVSYFSKDGENWIDLFNYTFSDFNRRYISQLACIKAFAISDKLNSTLKLDVSDKGVDSANIKAMVRDQYGNLINSGEVVFTIEGSQHHINVSNGMASIVHIFENRMSNVISAVFNSEGYNPSQDSSEIIFHDAIISLSMENATYGEDLVAEITLKDENGNFLNDIVTLAVSNRTYDVQVNGRKSFVIPDLLDIGSYEVNVTCRQLNDSVLINVSKAKVELEVNVTDLGDHVAIDFMFSKSIDVMVNVSVSGKNYPVNAVCGKGSLILDDLDYGSYQINVTFENKNYDEIHKDYVIQTSAYKSKIAPVDFKFDEEGIVYLVNLSKWDNSPIVNQIISFTINGQTYQNVTDADGCAKFVFNIVNGMYSINVDFAGYGDILGCKYKDVLNVNRVPVTVIDISIPSKAVAFDERNIVILFSDNARGNLTVSVDNVIFIDGYYNSTQFDIPLSGLGVGSHDVSVSYSGIEGYSYSNVFNISLAKAVAKVEIKSDNLYVGQNAEIIFSLPSNMNGYVFVDVEGRNYYSKIADGRAIFKIDALSFGKKTLYYSYDGDNNYLSAESSVILDVIYSATLSGNKDVVMSYDDGSVYRVQLSKADGASPSGEIVTVNIDGKSHRVTADRNGWVSFKINSKPGSYIITADYNGFKVSNKVTVKSIVKLNTVKIRKSAKKVIIKATLSKVNGKYLKGKKITFKFNGKKYSAKTNNKGVAKVSLKKNVVKKLKANKRYSIQVSYLKDMVKKSIIVKK